MLASRSGWRSSQIDGHKWRNEFHCENVGSLLEQRNLAQRERDGPNRTRSGQDAELESSRLHALFAECLLLPPAHVQANRQLTSDARASPPLMSGTMINSSTVTSESLTS